MTASEVPFPRDPTNLGVPFVFPLVLLYVTVLQSRAYHLWSESRMLRKLRVLRELHGSYNLAQQLIGPSHTSQQGVKELFSKLYICLSKGRHRATGRTFRFMFVLFFFSLDFVDFHPLLRNGSFVTEADVVVGMRVMIYVGSLSVFGARSLTIAEAVAVMLFCSLYGVSLWLLAPHPILYGERPGRWLFFTLFGVRGALTLVHLLWYEVREFISNLRGCSVRISDIANAIREQRYAGNSEQIARFNEMLWYMRFEKSPTSQEIEDFESCGKEDDRSDRSKALRGEKGGQYWPWVWKRNVLVPLIVFASNGLLWGGILAKEFIPTMVVVETFECLTWMLLVINDTQVEPRLFIEILEVAERARTIV